MWVGQGKAWNSQIPSQQAVNIIPAFQIHIPNFGRQTASGGVYVPANPASLCQALSMILYNQSRFAFATSAGTSLRPVVLLAMFDFFRFVAGGVVKRVPKFMDPPHVKEAFGGMLISSDHVEYPGREL
jgi:hypothetical protein